MYKKSAATRGNSNFFTNFRGNFFVMVNYIWFVNDWQSNLSSNQTRALFTSDSLQNGRRSQNKHDATMKFVEEVHISPAVWDVSSVVYKDAKSKPETKWRSKRTNWVSFELFPTFVCFLSSLLLFLCSTWVEFLIITLSQHMELACCKLPCVVIWRELDVRGTEFANFLKFSLKICVQCKSNLYKISIRRSKCTKADSSCQWINRPLTTLKRIAIQTHADKSRGDYIMSYGVLNLESCLTKEQANREKQTKGGQAERGVQ